MQEVDALFLIAHCLLVFIRPAELLYTALVVMLWSHVDKAVDSGLPDTQ